MTKYAIVLLLIYCCMTTASYAQRVPRSVQKYLDQQNAQAKKDFPPKLTNAYPDGSLGSKLHALYKEQAESACGIGKRSEEREYIPQELRSVYGGDAKLRKTQIYDLSISATNLLFLTLSPSDIASIRAGNFQEQNYIRAKRVLGLRDNLVNYGNSTLAHAPGFDILLYQKSCGSYFGGNASANISVPIAELKTSLRAETEKSSSITTVTGKFISPLHTIFRENSNRSVYAHMLLWEIYYEQARNETNPQELLINNGQYISEFDATLTYRAKTRKQSLDMQGQLSSSVSFGFVEATGQTRANLKNAAAFSLNKFNTSLHKLDNGTLSWDPVPLPSKHDIEEKLQNSFISGNWTSSNGYATHLLPLELSRTMVGVPASLCQSRSWEVASNGFDNAIWEYAPEVSSSSQHKEGQLPTCACKITGQLKRTAIERAINRGGFLNIELSLVNKASVGNEQLSIKVIEKNVQVTDNPKILPINSEPINTNRKASITQYSRQRSFIYPISFLIADQGVEISSNFTTPDLQIEFVNPQQATLFLSYPIRNINKINKSISFELVTRANPDDYIQDGEYSVPVKVKCFVPLERGGTTQLVTNTIILTVPNLIPKPVEVPVQVIPPPPNSSQPAPEAPKTTTPTDGN